MRSGASLRILVEQDLAFFFRYRPLGCIHVLDIPVSAHGGRPCRHAFEPTLQVWKRSEVLPMCFVRNDPRVTGNVGNREFAGDKRTVGQVMIEHAIEPAGFARVAIDA